MTILVADVGGTNTRFALATLDDGHWRLSPPRIQPTAADFESRVAEFLHEMGSPRCEAFACSGAGPVADDGSIRLTNAAVHLRPVALARAAGVAQVTLVNDFAAIAHSLPALGPGDTSRLGGGTGKTDAARLVLGPGTGLGVAALAPCNGGWTVLAGEGGNAELAPRNEAQLEIWRQLHAGGERVFAERVLSGPGLERLYSVVVRGAQRSAPEIARAAWRGEPESCRVIEIFADWLGSYAGSLALIFGAQGGIYLAGGILPEWAERFPAKIFLAALVDKRPPYDAYLKSIPVFLITHPQPGLIGLVALAQAELLRKR